MHVDAFVDTLSDAGSIPAASTIREYPQPAGQLRQRAFTFKKLNRQEEERVFRMRQGKVQLVESQVFPLTPLIHGFLLY